MKHMKMYTPQPRKVVDYRTCDMCGNKIEDKKEIFQVNEVSIVRKTGYNYPDGGQGDIFEPDICANCFDKVVTPFLKSKGVPMTTQDWDY